MSCRIYSGCRVYVCVLFPYLHSWFTEGRFSSTSAPPSHVQTSVGQEWEGLKWRHRKTESNGLCKENHTSLQSGGPFFNLFPEGCIYYKRQCVCVVSTPDGIWKNKKTHKEKKPKATLSISYGWENIFRKSLTNIWRRNDDIFPGFCLTIKWTKMNCHR